jgi:glycosyltransferase involved in cell wall biosynthesis
MMKNRIYHLAFSEGGGAGNVAKTLSQALKDLKFDSTFLFAAERKNLKQIILNLFPYFLSFIDNFIIKKNKNLPFFSLLRATVNSRRIVTQMDSDSVINLHWTPGLISFKKLKKIENKKFKYVATLHDMWFITGGCHFSNDCKQFTSGCNECPMVRSIFRPLVAKQYQQKKKFFSDENNVRVISPSHDLQQKATRSEVMSSQDIKIIPYPISKEIYSPDSKVRAREKTNIDLNSFVVGFVAANINDPRKNFKDALKSVRNLILTYPEANIKFVVIGQGINLGLKEFSFVKSVGPIKDLASLATYFATFDVLLVTSTAENSPLVVIEGIMNKTYVISSSAGGAKEIIRKTNSGYVYNDFADLSRALTESYETKNYQNVGSENLDDHLSASVARQYSNLYQNLVSKK